MEKPWGVDDKTVNALADLAEAKKAWVAAPMPFRYNWVVQTAVAMRERGELGCIAHGVMRSTSRPPTGTCRTAASGCCEKEAGGGAMINLGIHGVDMFATSLARNRR